MNLSHSIFTHYADSLYVKYFYMERQYNFINILDTNKYQKYFTLDDYYNSNIHNIFSRSRSMMCWLLSGTFKNLAPTQQYTLLA